MNDKRDRGHSSGIVRRVVWFAIASAAAVLVHGYHPFAEDAEIYVPGVKKLLNPALYPHNQAFFASHARMTFYPNFMAWSSRLSHLPIDWVLLLWHVVCIFLLLAGCWKIGHICFGSERAAWCGALLVGALLTMPVAGTALYLMDQYLNPRSFSTSAAVWIIAAALERKYLQAAIWIGLTALIHPLMSAFSLGFLLLLTLERTSQSRAFAAGLFPLAMFPPITDAYRQAIDAHSYFFILRWEWFEWLGAIAPLFLFWWFAEIARRRQLQALRRLCIATIPFTVLCIITALMVTIPARLVRFSELQPMRGLLLVYIVMFIVGGGLLAQHVLRGSLGRWLCLFLPTCAGIYYAQRQLFPATVHIELPGRGTSNPWMKTFMWIRGNTPVDGYFALDPYHMRLPGEDQQGFRAIAERSMLADAVKDSGAVTMFPELAGSWVEQVKAQQAWKTFSIKDFQSLHNRFGVDWFVIAPAQAAGMECPYRDQMLLVCHLPNTPTRQQ